MLMPSVFRTNNIFDDFFGAPITSRESRMMKTDIMEKDGGYELTIDMPGVKKENVKAELNDGYLTVSTNSDLHQRREERGRKIYPPRALFRLFQPQLLCRKHFEAGGYQGEV